MFVRVSSGALRGIGAELIDVEIDVIRGLPVFHVVGLPDIAIRESRERVKSALRNSGYDFPLRKITVNLAPAGIRKEGAFFDLPVALALLFTQSIIKKEEHGEYLDQFLVVGELSLDGGVKGIPGGLSFAILAREIGFRGIILPKENVPEASLVSDLKVIGVNSLAEAIVFLNEGKEPDLEIHDVTHHPSVELDFQEVRGQISAKRALEIAAAGGHNVLMIGTPGTGKTMLAQRLPSILPSMCLQESLETTQIYSILGYFREEEGLLQRPPFRAPHHTISEAALVGGGHPLARPGEVSLAHNGVLFLDELAEFRRSALETLRQPIEEGQVRITRSQGGAVIFPARFLFVGAMNPCPCGFHEDPIKECQCSESDIHRYHQKISGPLLDRVDLIISLVRPKKNELEEAALGEISATIRARVEESREIQRKRLVDTQAPCNGQIAGSQVEELCMLSEEARKILLRGVEKWGLSFRGYHRLMKVSRTMADLENEVKVHPHHVNEALQFRPTTRGQQ